MTWNLFGTFLKLAIELIDSGYLKISTQSTSSIFFAIGCDAKKSTPILSD